MIPTTCFILGAGLGTRLRPLTESLPKPLLPVGGRPLVSYAMDHCLTVGVQRFVVNTHHLAAAYDKAFPDGRWRKTPIVFRHEPVILDTAGGLKNIEDLLSGEESLLVYNGDILSDLPLSRLLAAHREKGREATLALRSRGAVCNVSLDNLGEICDIRGILGNRGVRSCLFTGIYIVERNFFGRLTRGRAESVILPLVEMIRQKPGSVASVMIDEGVWEDVGSPEAYSRIFQSVPPLKYEKLKSGPNEGSRTGETPDGNGDAPAPANVGVAEDAAVALSPEQEKNGPDRDEEAFVRAALGIVVDTPVKLSAIGRGGSDRSYFRVAAPSCPSAILMRYGDMYEENDVYVSAAAFLRDIGVSVPAIYSHSPESRLILMEDLGDNDLYSRREKPWEGRRA
ncbi:MAG: nucleotidyltransferase family protein, partial [Syntrophales bacterium]